MSNNARLDVIEGVIASRKCGEHSHCVCFQIEQAAHLKNFRQTFKVTPQLHMESSLSSGAIGPLTDKDAIYIRRNIGYVKELAPFANSTGDVNNFLNSVVIETTNGGLFLQINNKADNTVKSYDRYLVSFI